MLKSGEREINLSPNSVFTVIDAHGRHLEDIIFKTQFLKNVIPINFN